MESTEEKLWSSSQGGCRSWVKPKIKANLDSFKDHGVGDLHHESVEEDDDELAEGKRKNKKRNKIYSKEKKVSSRLLS